MPVDYGTSVVGSLVLQDRLERFSLQLGRLVRVLRGDMAEMPAPPVDYVHATVPPPAQRPGCLGKFFPVRPARPARRFTPNPRYREWRDEGEVRHLEGLAADIAVEGLTTREVSEAASRSGLFNGVGHYDAGPGVPFAHTHVDINPPPIGGFEVYDDGPDIIFVQEPPRLWVVNDYGAPAYGWEDPGTPFSPSGPIGDS